MDTTTAPPIGVRTGSDGVPVQQSLVNDAVPELGSEPVGRPYMGDVREVRAGGECIEHPGPADAKFCSECGRARPVAGGTR